MIKAVANIFGLNTVGWIADMFVSWGFIAVIIIFQPEIRSLLEKLGKSNVFSRISTLSGNEKEHLVDELVKAVMILSQGSDRGVDLAGTISLLKRLCQNGNADEFDGHCRAADVDFW